MNQLTHKPHQGTACCRTAIGNTCQEFYLNIVTTQLPQGVDNYHHVAGQKFLTL